jgi:Family of unknown function (DUF5681)
VTEEQKQERRQRLLEAGKATRWKPGVSGNPAGPPKRKYLTDVITELLDEKFTTPEGREEFKKAVWRRLLGDKVSASMTLDRIWERIEGKIKDEIEVSVKDDWAVIIQKARDRMSAGKVLPELPEGKEQ